MPTRAWSFNWRLIPILLSSPEQNGLALFATTGAQQWLSPTISKPTHKEIKRYYEDLAGYAAHEVSHEGATSSAFQNLLAATCKKADWHLVPQLSTRIRGKQVRPDGTLRDTFNLHHGYWEAKDSSDRLDVEIRKIS